MTISSSSKINPKQITLKPVLAQAAQPITMEFLEITPAMAREFLGQNWTLNRNLVDSRVSKWRKVMDDNGWRLSHQGIAFDMHGNLIDGQHRMQALSVLDDDTSIMFVVFRYTVECDALGVFDIGAMRSIGDAMANMGTVSKNYSRTVAATASALHKGITISTSASTLEESTAVYLHHKDSFDWAMPILTKDRVTSPVRAAFIYAYPCDPKLVASFAGKFLSGVGLEALSPELALTRLMATEGTSLRNNHGDMQERNAIFYMTLSALKHRFNGTALKHLQHPKSDMTPGGLSFFASRRRALGFDTADTFEAAKAIV